MRCFIRGIQRFLFLIISLVLVSCAGQRVCKVPSGVFPLSRQATFVESTTTGESLIRATGKGCTFAQATLDAKRAAIWYVLYAGDRPILKTFQQRQKAKSVVESILSDPDLYIRWQSDVKSKRKINSYIYLTYLFRIDVNALKERLQEAGIITSVEQLAERIGLPSIAVLSKKNDPNTLTAITTLQEYLEDRNFEVYVKHQQTAVNKVIKKVALLEGKVDPLYQTALQFGSDIYLDVSVSVNEVKEYGKTFYKAVVNAKAYETATGMLIAASTGYSPAREVISPESVVQEATNDVADKITFQIQKVWVREAKNGKPFKIVVFSKEQEASQVDESIYMLLKSLSKRPIKVLASGSSMVSYIAYIKGIPNAYELYLKLKSLYKGPGQIEKVLDAGDFLIIKAGTRSEEITIE